MKRIQMSFAAAIAYAPDHAERTARKSMQSFDVVFQTWPNRESMARSIRMQQRGMSRPDHWRACVKLSDGEGF